MLVVWRLYMAIGFGTDDAKKIKVVNGELARCMVNWIAGREHGSWSKITIGEMTDRRDELRKKLKERLDVEIDAKSAISGLWQYFLPDHLVQSQMHVIYRCNKAMCKFEWKAKRPFSPATVMIQRDSQAPGRSVQLAIDQAVTQSQDGFLIDSVEIAIAARGEASTARDTRTKRASGRSGPTSQRLRGSCT